MNPSSNPSSRQMMLDRYQQGERDFSGVDLYQVDLSRVKVPGIILKDANLTGCNFETSDLGGADLSGANLSQANLEFTDLRGANLQGTNLRRSNLRGATLDPEVLKSAILTGCILPTGNIFSPGMSVVEQLTQPEAARSVSVMPSTQVIPIVYDSKVRSRDQFFQDLPRIPLISLAGGFLLFGLHLALLKANFLTYLLLSLALYISCYRTQMACLLPTLGLILVMVSGDLPIFLLLFGVLVLFVVLTYVIFYGYRFEESIASVGLVGGLPVAIMFFYNVMIGTTVGFSLTILLPAFLATGLGSVAPIDLETRRYSRLQIVQVTQMVGSIGLAIGLAIGLLALRMNLSILT